MYEKFPSCIVQGGKCRDSEVGYFIFLIGGPSNSRLTVHSMTHLHQILLWTFFSSMILPLHQQIDKVLLKNNIQLHASFCRSTKVWCKCKLFQKSRANEGSKQEKKRCSHKTCLLELSLISLRFANKWQIVIVWRQSITTVLAVPVCWWQFPGSHDSPMSSLALLQAHSYFIQHRCFTHSWLTLCSHPYCHCLSQRYGWLFSFWLGIIRCNEIINKMSSLRVWHNRHIEHNHLEAKPTA